MIDCIDLPDVQPQFDNIKKVIKRGQAKCWHLLRFCIIEDLCLYAELQEPLPEIFGRMIMEIERVSK